MHGRWTLVASLLLTAPSACKTTSMDQSVVKDAPQAAEMPPRPERPSSPKVCAAVRGNGDYINAHFAAIARYLRHYGLFEGFAGGSSASVTMFFYESIYANPVLRDCEGGACDEKTQALRASLMMKSLHGYMDLLTQTPEAAAIKAILPLVAEIKARIDANPDISWSDVVSSTPLTQEQVQALITILQSQDLRDLINPDFVALLQDQDPEGRQFRLAEVQQSLANPVNWDVGDSEDQTVFLKPGLGNFRAFAGKLARAADFYAGYGPHYDYQGVKAWLSQCAETTKDKDWWTEMRGTPCAQKFSKLLSVYRAGYQSAGEFHSRADDPIGRYLPAFGVTSVLAGTDAVAAFKKALVSYHKGQNPRSFGFEPDPDWVRVGVWGQTADLEKVESLAQRPDEKSRRFHSLGQKTWREVLSYSPAEPGLARGFVMSEDEVSVGGWPDLHPVLLLKEYGCDKVVYITRKGDESEFATGLARKLNLSDSTIRDWFSLEPGVESSFRQSLAAADGVWCTDWNATESSEFVERSLESWKAPFAAGPGFPEGFAPYPNRVASTDERGCTD